MAPRISVCVPNLNTRRYLDERFDTIAGQSLADYEVLVYDSFSTDGAWEYIQERAAHEPRMRAWQGPRAGTPGSWTPCLQAATGEYIYIATSDDTMAPDCLARLAAALDSHPNCDAAHCPLKAIDEQGEPDRRMDHWWRHDSMFAQSSGGLRHRAHVRRAPFDGLLHLLGGSVYVSATQLLIRRSLFDRVGYFSSHWGSIGDFNWAMRVGLLANVIHVPETWGGWRVHSTQATAAVDLTSPEHAARMDAMIDDAVAHCEPQMDPRLRRALREIWWPEAQAIRAVWRRHAAGRSASRVRRGLRVLSAAMESAAGRAYLRDRLFGQGPGEWARKHLDAVGAGPGLMADTDVTRAALAAR